MSRGRRGDGHSAGPELCWSRPPGPARQPAPITVRSTVGAGDSSVAGYVLADTRGLSAPDRLRLAVAYGSAAAALAGTALPHPEQLNTAAVIVPDLS